MSYTKHKDILQSVGKVIKHHKELTKAKGELFNIYEILNLKTKEVRTHSTFIAELLNPKGTHQMGNTFLEAFINLIKDNIDFKPSDEGFNTEDVSVFVEYYIGKRDDKKKVGGRIDILLKNHLGKYILIENKIDADDQNVQIERYCNYNKENNTVIYLSKFGDKPDDDSKGELEADNDFYIISYQNEILKWLERCQTIASDQPILRESIKQYKILVQKITNTLGNKQNMELKEIILNNLEEAKIISQNYQRIRNGIKRDFRKTVLELLNSETELIEYFSFREKKNITNNYASIWFNNKHHSNSIWFGVESFSGNGHKNGKLFIGIYSTKIKIGEDYNKLNNSWQHYKFLTFKDENINLSHNSFLKLIGNNKTLEIVAKEVVRQIVLFIKNNKELVNEKY